jgi:serine/threonine protein kinase
MSVPNSVEELLQLIRKSGMIDEGKLSAYLQRRALGRGLPTDPREAADGMIADGILTNFQSEQFLLGKWRGFTIGKFKLLERVGVGGMGQVFLCEHMFMKRRVAIKVLPPAKAEHPAALGRFYREARAAGQLEHPNIVRTHDIDQDGNLHFIVMEYVDGTNLLDLVKKFGPMDIGRAVSYVRQTALGLEYAFKNGIIHRDVKPGNVLVDRKGVARVLDMGLARFFKDQSDNLTVKYDDKIVLGTADYVAPEQVANSHSVDVRADVYALGATLYFLLAGHPPFPTGTVSQKLIWHRTKDPTPIKQVRSDVPDELAEIVGKLMAKDPAQRFQTPGEAADALAKFIPASVKLPTAAEMPVMCPAVMEGQSTVETLSDSAVVAMPAEMAMELVGAGTRNLAVPTPDVAAAPIKPLSPFTSTAFGGTATTPARDARMANPFGPKPGHGGGALPFDNHPTPTPRTPLPPARQSAASVGRSSTVNPLLPPPAPYLGEQPTNETARRNSAALIALVAACLVIAGGIAWWKFIKAPQSTTPAAVTAK